LEANPALAAVGTQVEIFSEGQPVSPNMQAYGRWLNSLLCPDALYRDRFVESPLCHPSVTFRREALASVGGWEEGDFPEDYQLWLKLLSAGRKLAAIGPVLHRWRDSAQRLTRTDGRYRPEAFVDLKARYLRAFLGRRPATVWGAGRYALKLARCLQGRGAHICAFVDVDPRKIGQRIDGIQVVGPEDVGAPGNSHLISAVGAKGARAEIRAFLAERGWMEGRDFTCAA
jgi:hypothetical protein